MINGFVKNPSAALRFNFVAADLQGRFANRPYFSISCAPSPACGGRAFYETIVPLTLCEIIMIDHLVKSRHFRAGGNPESANLRRQAEKNLDKF